MTPMNATTDTQPATVTDDTVNELGATAGNIRDNYFQAVDILRHLETCSGASADQLRSARAEVERLEVAWSEADGKFRDAYLVRSSEYWSTGVVFVPVEEYALEWSRITA